MITTMSLADARHVRDRVDRQSADVRADGKAMAKVIVDAFVVASQTCPRGTRPKWVEDLAYDVERDLTDRGRGIDLARLCTLATATSACGGSNASVLDAIDDLFASDTTAPTPALSLAFRDETAVQGPTDCAQMDALDPTASVEDLDRAIAAMHAHVRQLRTGIRAATRRKLDLLRDGSLRTAA